MIGAFNRDNFHYFCHWKQHPIRITPAPINAQLQEAVLPALPLFPPRYFLDPGVAAPSWGNYSSVMQSPENPLRSSMTSKCAVGMPGTSRQTRWGWRLEVGGWRMAPARKPWKRQPEGWFLRLPTPASHLPAPHSPKSSRAPSFLWSRDQHKGGVQSKQRISAQWLETLQKSMSIYIELYLNIKESPPNQKEFNNHFQNC